MSIKDFSAAIKSQAYRDWFARISKETILKTSSSNLREGEQSAEKTSFYIDTKTIEQVIKTLSNIPEVDPNDVSKVFEKLKSYNYRGSRKAIGAPKVEAGVLYYPRVSFDTINTILTKGFEDVLNKAREKNPNIKISDYFDRGHVFGIFPKKVSELRESLARNTTMADKDRTLLLSILGDLASQLEQQDLDTSNIKNLNFRLYSKYRKKRGSYLVELQLKAENQASGRAQGAISAALLKYFNPGKYVEKFTEGSGAQFIKTLVESKGSPSFIELLAEGVALRAVGKKVSEVSFDIPNTLIRSEKPKVNTTALNKKITDEKKKVKSLISQVKKIPKFDKSRPVNLVSLQNLINSQLQERIRQNMGTGSSRNVLNYRSGRFASSARVERMSMSRAGMITAFYSYMKNPYATFSEGGRQQNPRSRDPKLLISRSIREVATKEVSNRLRAVVV